MPPPVGRRPVLILTRSDALPVLANVTVAPLTRTIQDIVSHVVLSPDNDGVPTLCAVSLDNIMTARKSVLDSRIVALSDETMDAVFQAIRFVFAMPEGDRAS